MDKQALRSRVRTSLPNQDTTRPLAQKNLGTLFGPRSNLYVVSSLYSRLNTHSLEGRKLDPSASSLDLLASIQSLANKVQLLNEEVMEDILAEYKDDGVIDADIL